MRSLSRATLRRGPDRLQPALLDRLTDAGPGERLESPDRWTFSGEQLRESVRRDLTRLFNATNLGATLDLSKYPDVERSTLNFGIPDLAGRPASSVDPIAIARLLQKAIWSFEPRLLRRTVRVQSAPDARLPHPNALCFIIDADLWSEPVPLPLRLRTELNLESGEAAVTETPTE